MKPKSNVSMSFAASVRETWPSGGRLEFDNPKWVADRLKGLNGDRVTVSISTHKPPRTVAQNNFYWLYLTLIAEDTGHTPDELHEYFKGKFLTQKITKVFGQSVRMKGSTTNLTKASFSEYIDRIAEQTGIQPPPTENVWEK